MRRLDVGHQRVQMSLALGVVLVLLAVLPATATASSARILGFGFKSMGTPTPSKPVPAGAVKPGGTLRKCDPTFFRIYAQFRGMRAGLRFGYRSSGPRGFRVRWGDRWDWNQRRLRMSFPLYGSLFAYLHGRYPASLQTGGTTRARASVRIIRTCPLALFLPTAWTKNEDGSTTVVFDDRSHVWRPLTLRRWSFGDGSSSEETEPTHTYATNGDYDVRLRLRDNRGWNSRTILRLTIAEAGIGFRGISTRVWKSG